MVVGPGHKQDDLAVAVGNAAAVVEVFHTEVVGIDIVEVDDGLGLDCHHKDDHHVLAVLLGHTSLNLPVAFCYMTDPDILLHPLHHRKLADDCRQVVIAVVPVDTMLDGHLSIDFVAAVAGHADCHSSYYAVGWAVPWAAA